MKPEHLFRLRIPLCRLVSMPMVRPTLTCDIVKLEQEFVYGYRDGAAVFYVSTTNEAGESIEFTSDEIEHFGTLWKKENDVFENHVSAIPELMFLRKAKFFVCDGNHRLLAWMNHISRLHSADPSWHIAVDCILLETRGRIELVMQIMHDINKSTEDSHVKTNLVHTLYRVQKYGLKPMERFNEMLRPSERKRCSLQLPRKTWYLMPIDVFTAFIFRQEIAAASDASVRKYHEDTPDEDKTNAGVADAMRQGAKEKSTKLYQKMHKLLTVANPALGPGFLEEVESHWSSNEVPEMTLEKLQLVATCSTTSNHKVKFLQWWNSSMPSRNARHFPPKPVSEAHLTPFLNKCVWYAGLEDTAIEFFDLVVKKDKIPINMKVPLKPEHLSAYIEGWRIKLWDHAFSSIFKGAGHFKKIDNFKTFDGSEQAVRRVIFRYFKYELEEKGAMAHTDFPPFMSSWLDRSSKDCMFTPSQLRTFTTAHLSGGGWYLDCNLAFTHPSEVELRKSFDGIGVISLEVDEFAGLSDKQKQRAIARREATDKKKEARFQDIVTTKEKKEEERLAKLAAREVQMAKEGKAVKGKGKKKTERGGPIPASSTVDQGSQMLGGSYSGVMRKVALPELSEDVITHGTQLIVLDEDNMDDFGDLILNVGISELLESMDAQTPILYTEVSEFLKKFSGGKIHKFNGVAKGKPALDLIFFDCQENLPVPGVSSPPTTVPAWNEDNEYEDLQSAFAFAELHLHDDGCMIVFHSFSSVSKGNIIGLCETYQMLKKKEWLGMNRLHLTSALDESTTTQKFGISLMVKDLGEKGKSNFAFKRSTPLKSLDIGRDDMLINYTLECDLAMNGETPWRGARQKDPRLFQLLLEGTTVEGDLVLDCTASTGTSITACRGLHRHLVALEKDTEIFDALLKPMKKAPPAMEPAAPKAVVVASKDPDAMPVVARKFNRKARFTVED